ncbi:MAG: HEPN domain-containing protein [Thermoprotei archaeon]|nr:HEPN domain-containing protein [Thermoprotei archaeon]
MINIEMAKDYILRGKRCLREAELAFSEEDAAMTIRRAQEALELALKALLRLLGIEYPRTHDVSDVLLEFKDKLPEELRDGIEELAKLVAELAAIRGPAFYGYEREGIPASQAFSMNYAGEIFTKVKEYFKVIESVIKRYISS